MDGFLPTFIRRKQTPPRSVDATYDQPTGSFLNPKAVIVPLQENPRDPYRCLVKARDEVAIGQKIGERGEGPFALAVRATLSGKIKEVETHPSPHGVQVACVVIESDGREGAPAKISSETGEGPGLLAQAGIPLDYPRLSGGHTEILMVNGTEFEPNLSVRQHLFREEASRVVGGIQALMDLFPIPRACVCVDRRQPGLLWTLEGALGGEKRITPRLVGKSVPPAGEWVLAREVLGRSRRSLLSRVTFVDMVFLPAVYAAVKEGLPFLERPITISGSGIPRPQNLRVRVGTTFAEVIAQCGGDLEGMTQIVMGGALTGISQPTARVPVTAGTPGILGLVSFPMGRGHQSKMYQEGPCVRCAKCADRCPVSVLPHLLAAYCRKKMFAEAVEKGLFTCIDCGLCTYVCPARIPLGEILREAKARGELQLKEASF